MNIDFLGKATMLLEEELAAANGELGDLLNRNIVTVLAGNDGLEHAASGAFLFWLRSGRGVNSDPTGTDERFYHTVSSLACGYRDCRRYDETGSRRHLSATNR